MLLVVAFCFLFWNQFISNVNFSRATYLAERGYLEAIAFYTKAIKQNPTAYQGWYSRGILLSQRFSLVKKHDILAGDNKKEISNDFERALKDFNKTKQLAPNLALLDYNIGSLYLKYTENLVNINEKEKLYLQAEEKFNYALLLDPVFENIYFQLVNIELARGNRTKAIFWLKKYLKGPQEVKNPKYLEQHKTNQKALQVLEQLGGTL